MLDEFLEVNMGTEGEPRQTSTSRNMSSEEKKVYINYLEENMMFSLGHMQNA